MRAILSELVAIPSVTDNLAANEKALMWCRTWLKKHGITSVTETHEGRPILWWGAPPGEAHILFNTHVDVVPGPETLFTPRIKGGKIWGRGTADTKSSAAVFLDVSRRKRELLKKKKVCFSLVTDEEVGGMSTKSFIESFPGLAFALFGEPTGMKIVNAAKGIMQVRVSANGVSAHGSRPWQGQNAITRMNQQLTSFFDSHPTPTKETVGTTFNVSKVSGGTAINQVPHMCEVWFDVRYSPADRPDEIVGDLKKHFDHCEILKCESPIATEANNKHILLLSDMCKRFGRAGGLAFEHGSSDARHCTARGIPAVVFGPKGANLHQDDEWVDGNSMEVCADILGSVIDRL